MTKTVQHQISIVLLFAIIETLLCDTSRAGGPPPIAIDNVLAFAPTNSTKTVTTRSAQTYNGFQAALLTAVNKERASRGLSLLCMNTKLQTAAQKHSNDMASKNFMSHTGSNGSSLSQRITASGFKWTNVAENVAAGQKDVAAAMKSWMNSAGHKKNILGRRLTMFGCGYTYVATSTYKHYWTQDFGTGRLESCST